MGKRRREKGVRRRESQAGPSGAPSANGNGGLRTEWDVPTGSISLPAEAAAPCQARICQGLQQLVLEQAAKLSQAAEVEAQLRTAAAVAEASRADYANQLQAARIGELKARQQLLALQQAGQPAGRWAAAHNGVPTCPVYPLEPFLAGVDFTEAPAASGSNGNILRRIIAIKLAKYDGQEGNLAAEGILQGSLDHPNLLPLVALLKSACGQQTALVLPWADEGTLGNILKRRGEELGLEELLGLMGHACSGIKHMHDQGIAHLDIKPHNLLVFREGRRRVLKVADYGLSRRMVDPDSGMIDAGGQWWGSTPYMLPTAIDDPNHGAACDAFALLATLRDVLACEDLVAAVQPQMATCDWDAVKEAQDALPYPAMRTNALTRHHLPLYLGLVTVPKLLPEDVVAEPEQLPELGPLLSFVNDGLRLDAWRDGIWDAVTVDALAGVIADTVAALAQLHAAPAPGAAPPPAHAPAPASAHFLPASLGICKGPRSVSGGEVGAEGMGPADVPVPAPAAAPSRPSRLFSWLQPSQPPRSSEERTAEQPSRRAALQGASPAAAPASSGSLPSIRASRRGSRSRRGGLIRAWDEAYAAARAPTPRSAQPPSLGSCCRGATSGQLASGGAPEGAQGALSQGSTPAPASARFLLASLSSLFGGSARPLSRRAALEGVPQEGSVHAPAPGGAHLPSPKLASGARSASGSRGGPEEDERDGSAAATSCAAPASAPVPAPAGARSLQSAFGSCMGMSSRAPTSVSALESTEEIAGEGSTCTAAAASARSLPPALSSSMGDLRCASSSSREDLQQEADEAAGQPAEELPLAQGIAAEGRAGALSATSADSPAQGAASEQRSASPGRGLAVPPAVSAGWCLAAAWPAADRPAAQGTPSETSPCAASREGEAQKPGCLEPAAERGGEAAARQLPRLQDRLEAAQADTAGLHCSMEVEEEEGASLPIEAAMEPARAAERSGEAAAGQLPRLQHRLEAAQADLAGQRCSLEEEEEDDAAAPPAETAGVRMETAPQPLRAHPQLEALASDHSSGHAVLLQERSSGAAHAIVATPSAQSSAGAARCLGAEPSAGKPSGALRSIALHATCGNCAHAGLVGERRGTDNGQPRRQRRRFSIWRLFGPCLGLGA